MLNTELLCELEINIGETYMVGPRKTGMRIIANIEGGKVTGPSLKGIVKPGGADWAIIQPDGCINIDVRTAIETDDGSLIYVYYQGKWVNPPEIAEQMANPETAHEIDPNQYYFRTTPYFETSSEKYDYLNKIVSVGVGRKTKNGISYKIYRVL